MRPLLPAAPYTLRNMTLAESIGDVAAAQTPCMVIACAKRGRSDDGQIQTEMSMAMNLGEMSMAEAISMVAGLKVVYLQLVEHLARNSGLNETELHNAIAEQVNTSRTSGGPEP